MLGIKRRILVVDDEVVIREMLSKLLQLEGYDVYVAASGLEALEILRSDLNFDLLLTDLAMPDLDGLTLVHEAHKLKPDLVPIVMTGFGTMDTARAALKEGAYDYVLKPFNLSEIKLAVYNALERSQMTNEIMRLREISELFHLSEKIAAFRDEEALLDFIVEAALDRVAAQRSSIMRVSDDGTRLVMARSRGLPAEADEASMSLDLYLTESGQVHVQPLLLADGERIYGNTWHSNETLPKNITFVSVPLERKCSPIDVDDLNKNLGIGAGQPHALAVLNVSGKRNGQSFTDSDLKVLSILANHAAAALENVRLLRDLEDNQREIVFTLGAIVETRSQETGNHVKRVAEYSKVLGLKAGLNPQEAEILRLAAPLHDVGKVGISDALLNKPGKLTPEEYETVKTHAQVGYDMLKTTRGRILQAAAIIALQHHERYDGAGYPQGLLGKDIHLFGRIVGIADVFDALSFARSYKEPWGLKAILALFKRERGSHFDPELLDLFLADFEEMLAIQRAFPDRPRPSRG